MRLCALPEDALPRSSSQTADSTSVRRTGAAASPVAPPCIRSATEDSRRRRHELGSGGSADVELASRNASGSRAASLHGQSRRRLGKRPPRPRLRTEQVHRRPHIPCFRCASRRRFPPPQSEAAVASRRASRGGPACEVTSVTAATSAPAAGSTSSTSASQRRSGARAATSAFWVERRPARRRARSAAASSDGDRGAPARDQGRLRHAEGVRGGDEQAARRGRGAELRGADQGVSQGVPDQGVAAGGEGDDPPHAPTTPTCSTSSATSRRTSAR